MAAFDCVIGTKYLHIRCSLILRSMAYTRSNCTCCADAGPMDGNGASMLANKVLQLLTSVLKLAAFVLRIDSPELLGGISDVVSEPSKLKGRFAGGGLELTT